MVTGKSHPIRCAWVRLEKGSCSSSECSGSRSIRGWSAGDIDTLVQGQALPIDIDRVCQDLGVTVVQIPDSTVKWDGCVFWNPHLSCPSVALNAARPPRRRFTLAHELLHLLTERLSLKDVATPREENHVEDDGESQRERSVNALASRLMIPRPIIEAFVPFGTFTACAVTRIADRCDVSLEAAAYALGDLASDRAVIVVSNGQVVRARFGSAMPFVGWYRGTSVPEDPAAVTSSLRRILARSVADVRVEPLRRGPELLVLAEAR